MKKEISFEEALKEMETISSTLEKGNVSLSEATNMFSRGVELTKTCYDSLKQTEGKISVFREELGKIIEKPFTDAQGD